jgi:hypothetical protein
LTLSGGIWFCGWYNNGRDDVEEWENSMDYRLGKAYQDDDNKQADAM